MGMERNTGNKVNGSKRSIDVQARSKRGMSDYAETMVATTTKHSENN